MWSDDNDDDFFSFATQVEQLLVVNENISGNKISAVTEANDCNNKTTIQQISDNVSAITVDKDCDNKTTIQEISDNVSAITEGKDCDNKTTIKQKSDNVSNITEENDCNNRSAIQQKSDSVSAITEGKDCKKKTTIQDISDNVSAVTEKKVCNNKTTIKHKSDNVSAITEGKDCNKKTTIQEISDNVRALTKENDCNNKSTIQQKSDNVSNIIEGNDCNNKTTRQEISDNVSAVTEENVCNNKTTITQKLDNVSDLTDEIDCNDKTTIQEMLDNVDAVIEEKDCDNKTTVQEMSDNVDAVIEKNDTTTINEKYVTEENEPVRKTLESELVARNDRKKHKKRKRMPTRKKLKYISSSDEDIPLSMYTSQYIPQNDSDDDDDDETFAPNSYDLNSTDSEYYSDLSDTSKQHNKRDTLLKKTWDETVTNITKMKNITKTKNQRKKMPSNDCQLNRDSTVEDVKRQSYHADIMRKTLIAANEGRLDQLLNNEGLQREKVPPYGNCFFHAACHSGLVSESHTQLRQSLCAHLKDNALEYIGFILNKYSPEKEEEFISEYLVEIENLKKDGYWSSKVADLLPLVLANYADCSVTIFTSKPDQERITVIPTLKANEGDNDLKLAYISVPNILEHYDACTAIQDCDSVPLIALKIPNANAEMQDSNCCSSSAGVNQTPKKAAKFISPAKKRLFRKRKATPENWKKNVRKRLKICGEEYVSPSGKIIQKKQVQECDCSKCKYKCNEKVSFQQRCAIRDIYYGLDSYERKKDYICSSVQEQKTKTYLDDKGNKVEKKKQVMRLYTLVVEKERVRVCKKFFLKTFSFSEATVTHALSKKVSGHFQGRDERGRHRAPNKTSEQSLQEIKNHIESFPTVEPHYVRKSSKRQYLANDLNIKRMYEEYASKCKENGTEAVNEPIYRRVFNEEYNISFHVPKKDQCNICNKYDNAKADGTLDDKQQEEYTLHQYRKVVAREQKHKDSNIARQCSKVHTCTFDLQSVLYTPCSLVSVMYYMRKLCCYNLSVYSAGDKKASCFLWSEIEGKRGSNEISTCLNLYLSSLESATERVILYSDACPGQNRNQIVATCLLHSVTTIPNIKIIDHKFLESGHTHMECDSMHAAIEFAKSKTKIFVPSQWDTVISMARRRSPYHVVTLKHGDFKDFKGVKSKTPRTTKTENGQKPKWTSMKWMRFIKDDPDMCHFKYDFDESEEFQKVKMSSKRSTEQLQPLYKSKLQISSAKKKDLIALCKKGVIPAEFHEYYKGLSANQTVKERLPVPDKDESDDDTDIE